MVEMSSDMLFLWRPRATEDTVITNYGTTLTCRNAQGTTSNATVSAANVIQMYQPDANAETFVSSLERAVLAHHPSRLQPAAMQADIRFELLLDATGAWNPTLRSDGFLVVRQYWRGDAAADGVVRTQWTTDNMWVAPPLQRVTWAAINYAATHLGFVRSLEEHRLMPEHAATDVASVLSALALTIDDRGQ